MQGEMKDANSLASGSIPTSPEREQVRQPNANFLKEEGAIRRLAVRGSNLDYRRMGTEPPFPGGSCRALQVCLAEIDFLREAFRTASGIPLSSAVEPSTSVSTEAQNEANK